MLVLNAVLTQQRLMAQITITIPNAQAGYEQAAVATPDAVDVT